MARIWGEILARVTAIDQTFRLIKCPGDLEERPIMRLPSGETDYFKKAALTAISSQIAKSRVSSGRRVDFRRTDCPRDSSARSKSQSTPFSEVPRAIDLPCQWLRKFSGQQLRARRGLAVRTEDCLSWRQSHQKRMLEMVISRSQGCPICGAAAVEVPCTCDPC